MTKLSIVATSIYLPPPCAIRVDRGRDNARTPPPKSWREFFFDTLFMTAESSGHPPLSSDTAASVDVPAVSRITVAQDRSLSDMMSLAQAQFPASGIPLDDIDAIIALTSTVDEHYGTSIACRLQTEAAAACFPIAVSLDHGTAIINAFRIAEALAHAEGHRQILVVGGEKWFAPFSRRVRGFSVLGDGAAALLLRAGTPDGMHILAYDTQVAPCAPLADTRDAIHLLAEAVADLAANVLAKADLRLDAVDRIVPHRANADLSTMVGRRLSAPGRTPESEACEDTRAYLCSAEALVNLHEALAEGPPIAGAIWLIWTIGFDGAIGCAVLRGATPPVLCAPSPSVPQ